MAEKKQYNLRITEELIERLTKLGARCGYGIGFPVDIAITCKVLQ